MSESKHSPTSTEEVRITPRPVREEQAWQEIGVTQFAPGIKETIFFGFFAFILLVPIAQLFITPSGYAPLAGHVEQTFTPSEGSVEVQATVVALSEPPDTKGVYNDFIMQLHLVDLVAPEGVDLGSERLALILGMKERVVMPVAGLLPGSKVTLHLLPWEKVEKDMAGINGSVLEDEAFLTMERSFVEHLEIEGHDARPSGKDFLKVWDGHGGELPTDHRLGVGAGISKAWSEGENLLDSFLNTNSHLSKRISLYETELDDTSIPALMLRSPVQGLMSAMGVGNEKAYVGRKGWLFFTPGVQALTGKGFLDPSHLHFRTRTSLDQPDPRKAILDFRDQLKERGIELILVPAPVKPSIHPEYLSARFEGRKEALRNRSMELFLETMAKEGVSVVDPAAAMMSAKASAPQYLKTDTHWTPESMEMVAKMVALEIESKIGKGKMTYRVEEQSFTQFGDIATMLKLPDWQATVDEETVKVKKVLTQDGKGWIPTKNAPVMLLGDSFTNIYHLGPMGWGAQAGFAQHISMASGHPMDLLAQNDAGAKASRQLLMDALKVDPKRLDGVKVVIWEFADRELAVGDWAPMTLPAKKESAPAPVKQEKKATPSSLSALVHSAESSRAAFGAKLAEVGDAPAFQGERDWLHLSAELRFLSKGPFWGEHAEPNGKSDPLKAIVDLKEQLEHLGIDFILAPAPPRAVVYADTVFPNVPVDEKGLPKRLDFDLQAFYKKLEDEGVTVIDATEAFLEARLTEDKEGHVCCPQDTHWSPRGLQIVADQVVESIGEPDWLAEMDEGSFTIHDPEALNYLGDLVKRVEGHSETKTDTTIMRVTDDEAGKTPLSFDSDSPVLLLSDSHGLVFSVGGDMHSSGAGFGEVLSANLGFNIDRISRRGSGDSVRVDLARRFLQKPADAKKKRVLIYTFAARTFTEFNNWKLVPLYR